jgi:hypothetical protein
MKLIVLVFFFNFFIFILLILLNIGTSRGADGENEASRRVKGELLLQMDGVADVLILLLII